MKLTLKTLWPFRLRRVSQALGLSATTWTGDAVGEATAMACAAVWACVRIICDAVASLPLHLYRRMPDGGRERATEHPLYAVLHTRSNPVQSALRFRHLMQAWVLLWGNAYARIVRDARGNVVALWPIHPRHVRVDAGRGETLEYVVGDERLAQSDVFHLRGLSLDGIVGQSVISAARNTVWLSTIQERYAAEFFGSGGRRPYYLRKLSRFATDQQRQEFKASWQEAYGSAQTFHRPILIEGDIELHELGMSLEDAQFLASRQFSVIEICRWFLVPPHLVGDLSRATYNNVEHLNLEFVQYTLGFWLKNWEQEIQFSLLLPGEAGALYAEHDVKGLLRGDFVSRTTGYARLIQSGIMSVNEARALENLSSIEGGDRHWVPLNLQPL